MCRCRSINPCRRPRWPGRQLAYTYVQLVLLRCQAAACFFPRFGRAGMLLAASPTTAEEVEEVAPPDCTQIGCVSGYKCDEYSVPPTCFPIVSRS